MDRFRRWELTARRCAIYSFRSLLRTAELENERLRTRSAALETSEKDLKSDVADLEVRFKAWGWGMNGG